MKIKEGFVLRDVCNSNVVVAQGVENIDFNKIIKLNDSAAYLWKQIETDGGSFTPDKLADLLVKEYDIDRETASTDAVTLSQSWLDAGIVAE
ncbi:MAG: PqqD family protein [Bacteroidaceae bacterium]|nr:PqqD family protein [Bacteroidaceae bacterium]